MTEESRTGPSTDEEWEYASQRVRAIREQATANPVAAAAEARRYAEIANRVQTLRAVRRARGCPSSRCRRNWTSVRRRSPGWNGGTTCTSLPWPASSGLPAGDFG